MHSHILSLSLVVFALCGCKRPSTPPVAANTRCISAFGTSYDPVTGWTIRVSETNGIHIGPRSSSALGGTVKFQSTVSPSGWTAHPGWFAYAENEERVWIFDGERELITLEASAKEVGFHGAPFRYQIPPEVFGRLPDSVRQTLTKHD